jgi:predicted DNA-binding transcriptional regulator AlpA
VIPAESARLLGVHEAAELLGISKAAIAERRRAGTFPAPVVELRCGPIWRRSAIEKHGRTYRRGRGGYWSHR